MMPRRFMSIILAAAVLAGCAASLPQVEIQTVKIAVPVECREAEPERPQMPTDALPLDADVDQYVQAAAAEIARREGYEELLRTALGNCRATH